MTKIETYSLRAAFIELEDYAPPSAGHFMEVIHWHNGAGFDVNLHAYGDQFFRLTWGEFETLKKLIKELRSPDDADPLSIAAEQENND